MCGNRNFVTGVQSWNAAVYQFPTAKFMFKKRNYVSECMHGWQDRCAAEGLTWDLLQRNISETEASPRASLCNLAAVSCSKVCLNSNEQHGESANDGGLQPKHDLSFSAAPRPLPHNSAAADPQVRKNARVIVGSQLLTSTEGHFSKTKNNVSLQKTSEESPPRVEAPHGSKRRVPRPVDLTSLSRRRLPLRAELKCSVERSAPRSDPMRAVREGREGECNTKRGVESRPTQFIRAADTSE